MALALRRRRASEPAIPRPKATSVSVAGSGTGALGGVGVMLELKIRLNWLPAANEGSIVIVGSIVALAAPDGLRAPTFTPSRMLKGTSEVTLNGRTAFQEVGSVPQFEGWDGSAQAPTKLPGKNTVAPAAPVPEADAEPELLINKGTVTFAGPSTCAQKRIVAVPSIAKLVVELADAEAATMRSAVVVT